MNSHIFSKIDRALVNAEWLIKFLHLEVIILDPNFSDHSPLCIEMEGIVLVGSKTFRFVNCIADHEDFLRVVRDAWHINSMGDPMNIVWQKLRCAKAGLKKLNIQAFK